MEWFSDSVYLIRHPLAAPLLLAAVSGTCTLWLLLRGFSAPREWLLVARTYLYDLVFSAVLMWPNRVAVAADPLGLYPYVAGAVATIVAAAFLGWIGRGRPRDYVIAFVAADLLLAAGAWLASGRPLTLALISRIVVAFAAAAAGVRIGRLARTVFRDQRANVSTFAWSVLAGIVSSVVGGVLAAAIIGS